MNKKTGHTSASTAFVTLTKPTDKAAGRPSLL